MSAASRDHLLDVYQLPRQSADFVADWDAVILPGGIKERLLSYASALRRLEKVPATALALRRAVLLYGPPGCGKTSLARGLPARWCDVSGTRRAGFIHVNTHALFSGVRGEGQKNVLAAFGGIAEIADGECPVFALIDEVETLGSDRASISMEANPLDALYQVTAFLESLDRCARECPNLTFVFTTNIPKAIDRAVRERVDFAVEVPLPDAACRARILDAAIRAMDSVFDVAGLVRPAGAEPADPAWSRIVRDSEGLSGRALRHLLVVAATLADGSSELHAGHVQEALAEATRTERSLRESHGMYLERYQESG